MLKNFTVAPTRDNAAQAKGITWVTFSSVEQCATGITSGLASIRYRTIIPFYELVKLSRAAQILDITPDVRPTQVLEKIAGDTIVLTKLTHADKSLFATQVQINLDLVHQARRAGVRVLADISDDHFSHPAVGSYYVELVKCCDAVIASTAYLTDRIKTVTDRPVSEIGDPYEGEGGPPAFGPPAKRHPLVSVWERLFHGSRSARRLRVLWFGHPTNWTAMRDLTPKLLALATHYPLQVKVVTAAGCGVEQFCAQFNGIHSGTMALELMPWSIQATWQALADCDVVVIPTDRDDPRKAAKSPNRLVESLWAGRFVAANDIPAYREFEKFAWVDDDICAGIKWALKHASEVPQRIARGQQYVDEHYSPRVIGARWAALLR